MTEFVVTSDIPSPHREKLAVVVQHLGGRYTGDLRPGVTTHMVTLHGDGESAQRARDAGAVAVSPGWMNASMEEGCLLPVVDPSPYLLIPGPKHTTLNNNNNNNNNKHPSDTDQLSSSALLFSGLGFYLSTFYSESTRNTLRQQIQREGGVVGTGFQETVTHVVCRFRVGDAYQWALHTGRTPVTAHWVDDCLQQGQVMPPRRVLHIPLPSNEAVTGMQGLQISITGFSGIDRTDLEFMVRSTGASFTGTLTRNNTHLICGKPGTDKHSKAVEWGSVQVVSRKWLEECVRQWSRVDEEAYILDLPTKSHLTAEHDPSSSSLRELDTRKDNTPLFMFSGKPSKQDRGIVERLGGQVSLVLGHYDPLCTHIILKNIARTEKWILKPEYITECNKENKFLNEDKFEWNGDKTLTIRGKNIWEGAPKKWRCSLEQTGKRAFEQWTVILYGETKPPHSFLKKLIEVGGGTVIPIKNGKIPEIDIDFAVVGKFNVDDPIISSLLRQEIPCINGMFLPDFLALATSPRLEEYQFL